MKLIVRRWYVVVVVRLPGVSEPACWGFGLDAYRAEAHEAAEQLAAEIGSA